MLIPAFVLVMLAPILALALAGTRNIMLAQVFQYALWIGGSLVIGHALRTLAAAYRRRPSDMLLDHEIVQVDGGRHHRFELGWGDVDPDTWSLELVKGTYRLRTGSGSEHDLVFAETHDAEERRSLADLLETLQTIARTKTGVAAERAAAPSGVLCCGRCGAPVAPEDVAAVACDYCAVACEIPGALRVRIREGRAQAKLRSASVAIVARLLDQPGAPIAARLLLLAAMAMLGAWLVGFGGMLVHLWNGVLDGKKVFVLLAFPMALILALFCGLRALFANRSALSLVAFHLGAGATAGGRPACRRCAGPLAAPHERSPIVSCAYCGTENVLGLELVRGTTVEHEHMTLEAAFQHRQRARRFAGLLAVAAALLAIVASALLFSGA
jgi:hypothetical protein